jgi:hypothetical protein
MISLLGSLFEHVPEICCSNYAFSYYKTKLLGLGLLFPSAELSGFLDYQTLD